MATIMSAEEAVRTYVKDGDTVICGGFLGLGAPMPLINEVLKQGQKDLTLVNNDGASNTRALGCSELIYQGQVKKFICSWCGFIPYLNEPDCPTELELCPMGSLIERLRCGGYGLGGVLTPTGLGTEVETRGWGERMTIDGKDWIYHRPIHGNVTLIQAYRADTAGNLIFHRVQRNMNPIMAMASDICICVVENQIEPAGTFDPDEIDVPGVVVDVLVPGREGYTL